MGGTDEVIVLIVILRFWTRLLLVLWKRYDVNASVLTGSARVSAALPKFCKTSDTYWAAREDDGEDARYDQSVELLSISRA